VSGIYYQQQMLVTRRGNGGGGIGATVASCAELWHIALFVNRGH